MDLPLSLFTSLHFIRGSHRNDIISITSLISNIGVMLGVAVLIIGLSAINGFERELNDSILAVISHGEIKSINQPWKNWNEALQNIKKVPGIITAAPYISFAGLAKSRTNLYTLQIKGIDLKYEENLSSLHNFVQNDAWKNFRAGEQQIFISKGIADILKIQLNDWISIVFYKNLNLKNKSQQVKHMRLHVTGILQLSGQLNYILAIVPLEDARQYLNIGDSITGINIKVNNIFNANKLVYNASKAINSFVNAKSWMDTYGYVYHDIQMIRTIIYLSMILVILIACFNIVSTLIIVVKNKSNDIAILRTLGAKDSFIIATFFWYGLLSGSIGCLCGILIGIIISLKLTSIFNFFEKVSGYQLLPTDIYFIDFLPSELCWLDVIYVLMITFSLILLTSWYPAYRASRIDPVNLLNSQ